MRLPAGSALLLTAIVLNACTCTPEYVAQGSAGQNSVTSRVPQIPLTTRTAEAHLCRGDLEQGVDYYDGLGRRAQETAVRASPAQADIIQTHAYDALGVESSMYQLYAGAPEGNGSFHTNAIEELKLFYNGASFVTHTAFPWSQTVQERSPLLRTNEQGYPGAPWQPAQAGGSSGHTTQFSYRSNSATEVRAWSWDPNNHRWHSPGFVPEGALATQERRDENGHATLTFRDHANRVVLVRVRNGAGNDAGSPLDTYYIHDEPGDLRVVLTPKAVYAMLNSSAWFLDATRDPKWVFERDYDSAHHVIEERIPGAAPRYYVYDALGRPNLFQDGNLRQQNSWLFTKYDAAGRVVLTGIYRDYSGRSRRQLQDLAETHARDNGALYEQRTTERDDNQGYTNLAFPEHDVQELLTSQYYDDHDFNGDGSPDVTFREIAELAARYPQRIPWGQSVGRPTGMRMRVLESGGLRLWLQSSVFYDARGLEIQAHRQRLTPPLSVGDEWVDTVYDFTGRPILTRTEHEALHRFLGSSSRPPTHVVLTRRFEYDTGGRVHRVYQRVNSQTEVLARENRYNELGVLVERNLHSTDDGRHFLQSLDFTYTPRGWIESLNDPGTAGYAAANDVGVADLDQFAYRLHYESTDPQRLENEPQWNGNVSAIEWAVPSEALPGLGGVPRAPDPDTHSYSLGYDWSDQLLAARYRHLSSSNSSLDGDRQYDEAYRYDPNGNLEHLERSGVVAGSAATGWLYGPVDRITLTYRGNQLVAADDAPQMPQGAGFVDSATTRGSAGDEEYAYDPSGNLVKDTNGGLATTRYNLRNLPFSAQLESGASVQTVYTATGEKLLVASRTPGQPTHSRFFSGSLVYEGDTLAYIETPEGRLRREENGSFTPEYYLTDPGNSVRVVIEPGAGRSARVLEEHHYSPFGRRLSGLGRLRTQGSSRRGYSGREPVGELALPWLDFGDRIYDAQLYRWNSLDPALRSTNPYAFVLNRPLTLSDPNGAAEEPATAPVDPDVIQGFLKDEIVPDYLSKILGVDPNTPAHNMRVATVIDYVIQLSVAELGAEAGRDKILADARTKMIGIREGGRSIGTELAPHPSESLILRDAERYLWGRTGPEFFEDRRGVPALVAMLSGNLVPKFYDVAKFLRLVTLTEPQLRVNPNNPVSARGGNNWFQLGTNDAFFEYLFPQQGVPQAPKLLIVPPAQ